MVPFSSLRNYIPDENKFKLAGPPSWWLTQLWDFDHSLVVVPSRQGFYYRLAQRRRLQLSEKMVNDALFKESDTKMLARYSLVPVTTILATANWSNPFLFVELANRAPWRLGGAAKVNAMLDAHSRQDALDTHLQTDAHLTDLARDGWQLYRNKIGLGRSYNIFPQRAAPPRQPPPVPVNRHLIGFSNPDLA